MIREQSGTYAPAFFIAGAFGVLAAMSFVPSLARTARVRAI